MIYIYNVYNSGAYLGGRELRVDNRFWPAFQLNYFIAYRVYISIHMYNRSWLINYYYYCSIQSVYCIISAELIKKL